jgi:hypothetical protein
VIAAERVASDLSDSHFGCRVIALNQKPKGDDKGADPSREKWCEFYSKELRPTRAMIKTSPKLMLIVCFTVAYGERRLQSRSTTKACI